MSASVCCLDSRIISISIYFIGKQTLWPILHYILPEYVIENKELGDEAWKTYVAVNEKFAQQISDIYEPGDKSNKLEDGNNIYIYILTTYP